MPHSSPRDNNQQDFRKNINLLPEELRGKMPAKEVSDVHQLRENQGKTTHAPLPRQEKKSAYAPKGLWRARFQSFLRWMSGKAPLFSGPVEPAPSSAPPRREPLQFKKGNAPKEVKVQLSSFSASKVPSEEKKRERPASSPSNAFAPHRPAAAPPDKTPAPKLRAAASPPHGKEELPSPPMADHKTPHKTSHQGKGFPSPVQTDRTLQHEKGEKKYAPPLKTPVASIKAMVDDGGKPPTASPFHVNLIPEELRETFDKKVAVKKAAVVGVASVLVVALSFFSLLIFMGGKRKMVKEFKQRIESIEKRMAEAQGILDQLVLFTEQSDRIAQLLKGHSHWSELFTLLEEETLPQVYYESVKVEKDQKVVLLVVARNYHDLARQYLIFEDNPRIDNVELTTAALDTKLWEEYLQNIKAKKEEATTKEEPLDETLLVTPEDFKKFVNVKSAISFYYAFEKEQKE